MMTNKELKQIEFNNCTKFEGGKTTYILNYINRAQGILDAIGMKTAPAFTSIAKEINTNLDRLNE